MSVIYCYQGSRGNPYTLGGILRFTLGSNRFRTTEERLTNIWFIPPLGEELDKYWNSTEAGCIFVDY